MQHAHPARAYLIWLERNKHGPPEWKREREREAEEKEGQNLRHAYSKRVRCRDRERCSKRERSIDRERVLIREEQKDRRRNKEGERVKHSRERRKRKVRPGKEGKKGTRREHDKEGKKIGEKIEGGFGFLSLLVFAHLKASLLLFFIIYILTLLVNELLSPEMHTLESKWEWRKWGWRDNLPFLSFFFALPFFPWFSSLSVVFAFLHRVGNCNLRRTLEVTQSALAPFEPSQHSVRSMQTCDS